MTKTVRRISCRQPSDRFGHAVPELSPSIVPHTQTTLAVLYLFSLRANKDPKLDHRPTPDAGVVLVHRFYPLCIRVHLFFV